MKASGNLEDVIEKDPVMINATQFDGRGPYRVGEKVLELKPFLENYLSKLVGEIENEEDRLRAEEERQKILGRLRDQKNETFLKKCGEYKDYRERLIFLSESEQKSRWPNNPMFRGNRNSGLSIGTFMIKGINGIRQIYGPKIVEDLIGETMYLMDKHVRRAHDSFYNIHEGKFRLLLPKISWDETQTIFERIIQEAPSKLDIYLGNTPHKRIDFVGAAVHSSVFVADRIKPEVLAQALKAVFHYVRKDVDKRFMMYDH